MRYFTLLLALLPLMAFSVDSSTLEQEFNKCKAITDSDLKRLICFDEIKVATSKRGEAPKPVVSVESQPQKAEQTISNQKQRFGLKDIREDREPESIKAKVSKIKKNGYGKLTIYLDDGQVWKQNENSSILVKKNDIVIVKQAAFNSYLMNKEGSSRSMRVKRLK